MRLPALAAILLTGCGSFTHFQTARSLEAGRATFDFQGATIAMNEGFHNAARFRLGLGAGLEAGVETDLVSLLFLQYLTSPGGFGLIMGDLKWQLIDETGPGAPCSFALGFGGGSGFLTDFYFGQATVSRNFGHAEPYLAWRYQRIRLDLDLDDPDDVEDLKDSYLREVFEEVQDSRFGLHHAFLGVRFWVTDSLYVSPEVSWLLGEAEGVGSVGLAIGFLFP